MDEGVDYFEFAEAVAELVESGHLELNEDGRYVITEKGTDSLLDFQQEWNRLCGLVEKIFREDRR